MARANEIFADETLTVADDRRDYGESRHITIGFLDARMVVVVWTPRAGAFRIVSMRKANDREQSLYGPRFSGRRP
nr:BrnT family toxin [Methylocapsa sp. S129]